METIFGIHFCSSLLEKYLISDRKEGIKAEKNLSLEYENKLSVQGLIDVHFVKYIQICTTCVHFVCSPHRAAQNKWCMIWNLRKVR